MYGAYFVLVFLLILVAYAGWEETMRLIAFAELQVKYAYVRVRMYQMKKRLKRQLVRDTTDFERFLKEYQNERDV